MLPIVSVSSMYLMLCNLQYTVNLAPFPILCLSILILIAPLVTRSVLVATWSLIFGLLIGFNYSYYLPKPLQRIFQSLQCVWKLKRVLSSAWWLCSWKFFFPPNLSFSCTQSAMKCHCLINVMSKINVFYK
jgi:hypothetical protein